MKRYSLLFLLLLSYNCIKPSNTFLADTIYVAGNSYFGRNNYIEYGAGNLPLIFSAPHGGSFNPAEIPDRTFGSLDNDTRTKEMAHFLFSEIFALTGKYPHMIVNDLRRIKLDANRDSLEAAQGNQYALQAWREYQNYLKAARIEVTGKFGKGLYVDLHGHGHTIQRLEIGYLLSGASLDKSDSELNTTAYINNTSIKNLVKTNVHSLSLSKLLRGEYSLGNYFETAGYPSVPSPLNISPLGSLYFEGGYCTVQYGSLYQGTVDGIQIEHNFTGIRNSDINVKAYAKRLAKILIDYLNYHYAFNITDVKESDIIIPKFSLDQNYPNPFNPTTKIVFTIPKAGRAKLDVYNILGQKINCLFDSEISAGEYSVEFISKDLSAGIYFYQLRFENYFETRKMMLVK